MTPNGKRIYSIFTSSILFLLFVKCWQSFLGLNPIERTVSKLKRKFLCFVVFTYSIKRSREIRKFHVAQRRVRNVQERVRHVQINVLFCKHKSIAFFAVFVAVAVVLA